MSWEKINSKVLISHPRIELHEDTILLPNGEKSDYIHFGEPNDAVTIIAIRDDGKVFIQKEYSYPPDAWLFQFPGGGAEGNETPEQAAARELAEEASLGGELTKIGSFLTNNRRSAQRMHVFVAKNLYKQEAQKDIEEEFEDFWFQSNEVDRLIAEGELCIASALSAWALFRASQS